MQIVFQPIVNLKNNEIVGYEALARFENESPYEAFRRTRERSETEGVAMEVEAVKRALEGFRPAAGPLWSRPYLSVNASVMTIMDPGGVLLELIRAYMPVVSKAAVELVVEMTEHGEVTTADYMSLHGPLKALRAEGAKIAVDDMGKGISDLWHAIQIIPHILKIDRDIVFGSESSVPRQSLLEGLVLIANRLNITLVAEGIETEAQRDWCTLLGVHCGQGYLFGRPEPFPEFEAQLETVG